MIFKQFQLNKLNLDQYNFFLFYGKNEGLQNEIIERYFIKDFKGEVIKYDENEILNNIENIISEILNKSLFSSEKILIISRTSEKSLKFIKELQQKKLNDLIIIHKSNVLEKKSKLRNLFEKDKNLVIVPFY